MNDGVEWVDLGLEEFMRGVRVLDQTKVRVGVVGPAASAPASSGRITIAEAALISEFGSRKAGIPGRHAISGTITPEQALKVGEDVARTVMSFGNVDGALDEAGRKLAEVIVDRILRGDFEPNATSTVKKKGFDHPLIDTSGLVNAVGHQLVRGSGDIVESGAAVGDFEAFEVGGDE